MQQQTFISIGTGSSGLMPPSRLTPEEAQAVIRLWQQEQADSGMTDRPSLADMAEGLDIAPAEVQRLLARVRATPLIVTSQEASIACGHRLLAHRLSWYIALSAAAAAALGAGLLHFIH